MKTTETRAQISNKAVKEFPILENFNSILIPVPKEMTEEQRSKFMYSMEMVINYAVEAKECLRRLDVFSSNAWIAESINDDVYAAFAKSITELCYHKGITEEVTYETNTVEKPEDETLKKVQTLFEKFNQAFNRINIKP